VYRRQVLCQILLQQDPSTPCGLYNRLAPHVPHFISAHLLCSMMMTLITVNCVVAAAAPVGTHWQGISVFHDTMIIHTLWLP
jgi:hypothetical protein